jgi:hypothetical protein
MNWLHFGDPRLEEKTEEIRELSRALQRRMAEYEKQPDPFRAMTTTMATNAYEERQERNIWKGRDGHAG